MVTMPLSVNVPGYVPTATPVAENDIVDVEPGLHDAVIETESATKNSVERVGGSVSAATDDAPSVARTADTTKVARLECRMTVAPSVGSDEPRPASPGSSRTGLSASRAQRMRCPPEWRKAGKRASHRDDDLAPRATVVDPAQGVDHLVQRELSIDHRFELAGRDQLLQGGHVVGVERLPPDQEARSSGR